MTLSRTRRLTLPTLVVGLAMVCAPFAHGATLTVNSSGDQSDLLPGDSVCATATATCTLRSAIEEANALAGSDTILFSVGSGAVTITPATPLPDITDAVTIDGTSQPGYGSTTLVEIDGTSAGAATNGLHILVSGATVRAIAVNRFTAVGIWIRNASGTVVDRCRVGTDPNGTVNLGNASGGIRITNGSDSVITSNLVAFNGVEGISVYESENGSYPTFTAQTPTLTTVFPTIDFTDSCGELRAGSGPPLVDSNGNTFSENIGIRLTATMSVPTAGSYTFSFPQLDDQVTLRIDGVTYLSATFCCPTPSASVSLSSGSHSIEVDYLEGGGGATLQLTTSGPGSLSFTSGAQPGFFGELFQLRNPALRNRISMNSIHDNGAVGITLSCCCIHPNDTGDIDVGPNTFLNFPILTNVKRSSGFDVLGKAAPLSTVEIFGSSDRSTGYGAGHGDGATFLATTSADPSGNFAASIGSASGFEKITATATDPAGNTSEFSLSSIALAPASLPNATAQSFYSQALTASGGSPGYSFSLATGTLPAGLTINSSGVLSGTPSSAGVFSFTLQAADTTGSIGARVYSLRVCAAISLSPTLLPDGIAGSPYSQTVTATGGVSPYTFTIGSGTLPPGLTLDLAGNITGTPTAGGSYTLTITSTDTNGCSGSAAYNVVISTGTSATALIATAMSTTSVALRWTPPLQPVTGFDVQRSLNGSAWGSVGAALSAATNFTDSTGLPATLYYYRLVATGPGGPQPPSNVVTAQTFPSTAVKVCRTRVSPTHQVANNISGAFNGSQWGVAWSDKQGGSEAEIYFRLLDRNTAVPSAPAVRVTNDDVSSRFPVLRWNGTSFGLLWLEHTRTPAGETEARFAFARLDANGNKIRGDRRIFGTNPTMLIGDGETPLVWDGGGWGIFLQEGPEPGDINFHRLDQDGNVLTGPVNITNSPGYFDLDVSAAWSGTEYGVSWIRHKDSGYSVMFERMQTNGTVIGVPVDLWDSGPSQFAELPSIVWNGSGWAVAWTQSVTDDAIYMRRLDATGTPIGPETRVSDDLDNGDPVADYIPKLQVASGGGYVIFTMSSLSTSSQLEISRLTADAGGNRTGSRTLISGDDGFASQFERVAFDGSSHLVAWGDSHLHPSEVRAAVVNGSGIVSGGPVDITTNHTGPVSSSQATALPLLQGFSTFWLDLNENDTNEIDARIYAGDGSFIDARPLVTGSAISRTAGTAVGNTFIVVWTDGGNVNARAFDAAGSSQWGPVLIASGAAGARRPAIGWSGEELGAVYVKGGKVLFQRLTGIGALIGTAVALPGTTNPSDPLIQWVGIGWVIIWRQNGELFLTRLDSKGFTIVPATQITSGAHDPTLWQQAWSGASIGLIWSENRGFDPPGTDIYFAALGMDGSKVVPDFALVSNPEWDSGATIFWAADRFHVIYPDAREGTREIEVLPNGTLTALYRLLDNHGDGRLAAAFNGVTAAVAQQHLDGINVSTTAILTDGTPPSCPTLSASFAGNAVALSWTAASDPESTILGYNLYRDGLELLELLPGTLAYNDGGFTRNATHVYELRAVNGAFTESTCTTKSVFAGITVSPTTLPGAQRSQSYSQQLTASGGLAPFTFSLGATTLPSGLTLSSSGLISGTPTVSGSFPFTVTATDTAGQSGSRNYTLIVCSSITLGPTLLNDGITGTAYSQTVTGTGGNGALMFTISSGTLPTGLSLTASSGLISGSPTVAGSFTFTVTATDTIGCTASASYTVTIQTATTVRNLFAMPLSSTSVRLTWIDPGQNETGFRIQRSTDGGTSWSNIQIVGPDLVTYTDSVGLSAAKLYHYRIIAFASAVDAPSSNVAAAVTLTSTAATVCPPQQIDPFFSHARFASSAFNGTQWAAVWEDRTNSQNEEIYFSLLDATTGAPVGQPVQVSSSDMQSIHPTLRWNGSHFGVVWLESMKGPMGDGRSRTNFALLNANGTIVRTGVQIPAVNFVVLAPSDNEIPLVWNGTSWGLLDIHSSNAAPQADLVYYQLDEDGDVMAGPVTLTLNTEDDYDGTLAWSGTEYGLSWVVQNGTTYTVYFQRMQANGTLIGSRSVLAASGTSFLFEARTVWDGSGWAVAWTDALTDSESINLRLLNPDGTPKGAASRISDDLDGPVPPNDESPQLFARPAGGYVIFTESFLNVASTLHAEVGRLRADATGARLGARTILSTDDTFHSSFPRATTNGSSYLIAFNEGRLGTLEVGTLVVNDAGAVSSVNDLTIGHSVGNSIFFALPGNGVVAPLQSGFVNLWNEPVTSSSSQLYGTIFDGSGSVTANNFPLSTRSLRGKAGLLGLGNSFAVAWKEAVGNTVVFGRYDAAGAPLITEATVGTSANGPAGVAIAYDGQNYGLAWKVGQNSVAFQRVDPAGALLGPRLLIPGAGPSTTAPLLQWTGSGWALLWLANTDLYFSLLAANGGTLVPPIQVSFTPYDKLSPQMLWNGTKLGLFWGEQRGTDPPGVDIYFASLGLTGVKDFTEVAVLNGPFSETPISVNWDTDHFRLAFSRGDGTMDEVNVTTLGIASSDRLISPRVGGGAAWNGATLGLILPTQGQIRFGTTACLNDGTPPACPVATGSFNGSAVTLSWSASTDAGSGIYRYDVYRDNAMIGELSPSLAAFTDRGFVPNATHMYEVRAVNGAYLESTSCSALSIFAGTTGMPSIGTITPPCGIGGGGETVTITGSGFANGLTVQFDATPAASVTVDSGTHLTVVTPAHAVGAVPVTVTNPGNLAATLPNGFIFHYRGDANADCAVSVTDIFYLVNRLFTGGPPPLSNSDVNGDNAVSPADIFYLVNYLFAGGPPPLP